MDIRANAPMLPPLPSSGRLGGLLRGGLLRGVLLLLLLLPLALTGCGGPGQPPRAVLLDALALQIQLTQSSIAQALELEPPGLPQVSRVRVEEQQAVAIGQAKGLRLAGRFDWRLANDPIRVDSPFELYLEQGERGESWRLARPSGSDARGSDPRDDVRRDATVQRWSTYPLPLAGQRGRG
jgi:hypothetical protein